VSRKIALLLLLLAACKSKKPEAKQEEPPSPPPTDARVEPAKVERPAFKPAPEPKQTQATYEKLYLALAACQLEGSRIVDPCPEQQVLREFSNAGSTAENENWAENIRTEMAAAEKLMTAENPTVRVAAIGHVDNVGGDEDSKKLVTDAFLREKDPGVRKTLAIMISGADYPIQQQIDLMMQLAEDPDPEIRRAMLYGLGESEMLGTGANIPGAYEKVAEHLKSDPDLEARQDACDALGELGDPRAVKAIEAVLVDATPNELYDPCFEGLIKLWSWPENTVKAAYQRTLALIPKIERPLEQLYAFRALQWQYDDEEEAKRHPFVKRADIEKALAALAANKKASPVAREAAVEKLVEMQPDKKVFAAIRKSLPAPLPEDSEDDYGPLTDLVEAVDGALE
jgi:HEAT repeat protein